VSGCPNESFFLGFAASWWELFIDRLAALPFVRRLSINGIAPIFLYLVRLQVAPWRAATEG
jgi:hypothetical protein